MANIVILTGPVEKVEEARTQKNKRILKFTVKTTEHYNDKAFDSWHKCEKWDEDLRLSEGQRVEVVGKLKHSSWDKPDGTKGYKTFVDVKTVDSDVGGQPASQGSGPEIVYPDAPGPIDDDDLPF